jgi:hypothetical protein
MVQVLLARSWLRAVVSPEDPIAVQLKAVLSDEVESDADISARSTKWREFLNQTNPSHDKFRSALREMIGTPQGGAQGFGLADVSSVLNALLRFCKTKRFDSLPEEHDELEISEFEKICAVIKQLDGSVLQILREEHELLKGRASTLLVSLRGQSIQSHLTRVNGLVDTVSNLLPMAGPSQVKDWKTMLAKISTRLMEGVDREIEDAMGALSDDEDTTSSFGWLARTPARDLEETRLLVVAGDQLAKTMRDHVRDRVNEHGGSTSLAEINDIGRQLEASTRGAMDLLRRSQ